MKLYALDVERGVPQTMISSSAVRAVTLSSAGRDSAAAISE